MKLVLFDFDNVYVTWANARFEQEAPKALPIFDAQTGHWRTWIPGEGEPLGAGAIDTVVVFAMSTRTVLSAARANDYGLGVSVTKSYLRTLAAAMRRALTPPSTTGTAGVEITLVLPVPESADAALVRLLTATPISNHAGAIETLMVVGDDRGLIASVADGLAYASFPGAWRQGVLDVGGSRCATFRSPRGVTLARAYVGNRPSTATVLAPSGKVSRVIDNDEAAAQAATRLLDVPVGDDLVATCEDVERRPGLLGQVGPTRTSLAGIARLTAGDATFGVVGPGDGVEVWEPVTDPLDDPTGVRPASIGEGAVFVEGTGVTASTRLPVAIHLEANARGVLPVATVELAGRARAIHHDTDLLDLLTMIEPLQSQLLCQVSIAGVYNRKRFDLCLEALGRYAEVPEAWWCDYSPHDPHGIAATAKRRVEGEGRRIPRPLRVAAVPLVLARRVTLVAPVAPGTRVSVLGDIAPGTIGVAEHAGRSYALLALDGRLAGQLKVAPIQWLPTVRLERLPTLPLTNDPHGLQCLASRATIAEMQDLPLLVAQTGAP